MRNGLHTHQQTLNDSPTQPTDAIDPIEPKRRRSRRRAPIQMSRRSPSSAPDGAQPGTTRMQRGHGQALPHERSIERSDGWSPARADGTRIRRSSRVDMFSPFEGGMSFFHSSSWMRTMFVSTLRASHSKARKTICGKAITC